MLVDTMRKAFFTKKSELDSKGLNGFKYALNNLSKKNNLKELVKTILK